MEGRDYQVLVRCEPGESYIRLILKDNRMIGATLVGDTGLEVCHSHEILVLVRLWHGRPQAIDCDSGDGVHLKETFENLILNQLDLSPYGNNLLDSRIELEDIFD